MRLELCFEGIQMLRSLLLAATLALVSVSVSATDPTGPLYRVTIEARDVSATVLATPTMLLRSGSLGKARVGGIDGYELALELEEVSASKVQVTGNFESRRGRLAPKVIVPLGEQVTVKAGDVSLALKVERTNG